MSNATIVKENKMIQNEYVEFLYGKESSKKPPRKTKFSHPYSYDPFVIWQIKGKVNGSVYTDRLFLEDQEKAQTLYKKHMPNKRWDNADPKQVERFLQDYMDESELRLIMITEYCNQSTGFTLWRLDYFV